MAAQDAQARQAIVAVDSLRNLAVTLRAYAQLGQDVETPQARDRLAQARTDLDSLLTQLLRSAGKRLPEADSQRLQQRWRSVRDATFTRPSPELAALMSDIAEDLSAQLGALAAVAQPRAGAASSARAQARVQLEHAWQRQKLQQLAKEGLFGCWRTDLARWPRMDLLRAEFSRWLARQEGRLTQVSWVQYNAQWNLLTTSLPREDGGCTQQALQSLVGTTDRLAQMIGNTP